MDYYPNSVKDYQPIDPVKITGSTELMSDTEFREKMIAAMQEQGMSVAELSRRSGVSYDVINKLKRRDNRTTGAENAAAIGRVLGLESQRSGGVLERIEPGNGAPRSTTLVPVFDVSASAGHGTAPDQEPEVYSLAFPPQYLARLTSSQPSNLAIISVKGESMEPTLLDDDIVLIDRSKLSLSFDGLFVLRFDDALHVKRVGRAPKRAHITVISDNKDLYPPMIVPVSEVEPIGKVLWYGRRV